MKITAKDLVKLLDPLKLGSGKLAAGIQSGFLVVNGNTAYTFSGDIYAEITIPDAFSFGIGDDEGCTPYKNLIDVAKKYDGKEVSISVKDDYLVFACGRSRTKLSWDTNVCVPRGVVGVPKEDAWKQLPEMFPAVIHECEDIIDNRRESSVLSSIHVTPSFTEAASTARVIRCKCDIDIDEEFLLSGGQLSSVFDYPMDEYQVVDTRWFFVRGGGMMFGIPMHLSPYLAEMDGIFNRPGEPLDLTGIGAGDVKLAQAIMDRGDDLLVELKDRKCIVTGKGSYGKHSVEVDVDTDTVTSFYISPIDLGRILEWETVCQLGEKTLSVDTEEFQYVATIDKDRLQ